MKAPNIVDLEDLAKTEGSEADRKAATPRPKKEKASGKVVRRTHSLYEGHDKLIATTAAKLSKERGKIVNASEALRYLLDQVGGAK